MTTTDEILIRLDEESRWRKESLAEIGRLFRQETESIDQKINELSMAIKHLELKVGYLEECEQKKSNA